MQQALRVFIEACTAAGQWESALLALSAAGIPLGPTTTPSGSDKRVHVVLQKHHVTAGGASDSRTCSSVFTQQLRGENVLQLTRCFGGVGQWPLVAALLELPHRHLCGWSDAPMAIVDARREALRVLRATRGASRPPHEGYWVAALAVVEKDLRHLQDPPAEALGAATCDPTLRTSAADALRSLCLTELLPLVPPPFRGAVVTHWQARAAAVEHGPRASSVSAPSAAILETGPSQWENGGWVERETQALVALQRSRKHRNTWRDAIAHFQRLLVGSPSSLDVPEAAVQAILFCLTRQGHGKHVSHLLHRYILCEEDPVDYGYSGRPSGGEAPPPPVDGSARIQRSPALLQALAKSAQVLQSRPLGLTLLRSSALRSCWTVDAALSVLSTLHLPEACVDVLEWWDRLPVTPVSAEVHRQDPRALPSFLEGLRANIKIRSHVAAAYLAAPAAVRSSTRVFFRTLPSSLPPWEAALRLLADNQRPLQASLYKLRLLRGVYQWQAALAVVEREVARLDSPRHTTQEDKRVLAAIAAVLSSVERAEQWVPQHALPHLRRHAFLGPLLVAAEGSRP